MGKSRHIRNGVKSAALAANLKRCQAENTELKREIQNLRQWRDLSTRVPTWDANEAELERLLERLAVKPLIDTWRSKVTELEAELETARADCGEWERIAQREQRRAGDLHGLLDQCNRAARIDKEERAKLEAGRGLLVLDAAIATLKAIEP